MDKPFVAARVPSILVSRKNEMEKIRRAIYEPGTEPRVVTLVGAGGLGKTRMLQEVMRRAGHVAQRQQQGEPAPENDWLARHDNQVHVSDLIDLNSVSLTTTVNFQHRLQLALDTTGEEFSEFKRDFMVFRNVLTYQSNYAQTQVALRDAVKSFERDYVRLARRQRIVVILDTAEKLPLVPDSRIDHLLSTVQRDTQGPDYVSTRTLDWLSQIAEEWKLINTTIIVAGRSEGRWIPVIERLGDSSSNIVIEPFEEDEVQTYMGRLREEREGEVLEERETDPLLAYLEEFAQADRAYVLHKYTGGQPVRLALFTDVLAEGFEAPDELYDTPEEVRGRERAGELTKGQYEVEDAFIRKLFASDLAAELRIQILRTLVRTHYPMDVRMLEYLLDARPGQRPEDWQSDAGRLHELEQELDSMRALSFMKVTSNNRYFLQDELYEIFETHNESPELAAVERKEREPLYRKIVSYLDFEIQKTRSMLSDYWAAERGTMLLVSGNIAPRLGELSPLQWGLISFPRPRQEDVESRAYARQQLEEWQLERLYYQFRLDPWNAIHAHFYELAEAAWWEMDEDYMTQIQAQLWRFLGSKSEQRFVATLPQCGDRDYEQLEAVAEHDDAVRWLKRLHLRGQYKEVVDLADRIRGKMPKDWLSLTKTFKHELSVYENYSRSYIGGDDSVAAQGKLDATIDALQDLATDENEEQRVRRVIAMAYFVLGYNQSSTGAFNSAVKAYGSALRNLRATRFEILQIFCGFNMARAIAECGRKGRAVRICHDMIELLQNRGLGGTRPYALAQNTLALVHNRALEPEKAWLPAAMARACFERLKENRGLGLAELQLGEALRRLADSYLEAPEPPDASYVERYFEESELCLRSALRVFADQANEETLRRIEAEVELGTALLGTAAFFVKRPKSDVRSRNMIGNRDPVCRDSAVARRILKEAEVHFQSARRLSDEEGHALLNLDACWGQAMVDYWQGMNGPEGPKRGTGSFRHVRNLAEDLLKPDCKISYDNEEPKPADTEAQVLHRMARICAMLGQQQLDLFEESVARDRVERADAGHVPESSLPLLSDTSKQHLSEAARYYTISLGYAQMYAPRSRVMARIYNRLYEQIKGYNDEEMSALANYLRGARTRFYTHRIYSERTLEDVTDWLDESFGYSGEPPISRIRL